MCLLHFALFFPRGDLCQTLVFLMFFVENVSFFDLKSRKTAFFRGVPFGTPFCGEVLEPILAQSRFQDLSAGAPWEPLGSPWGALGETLGNLVTPWGAFGKALAIFGASWDTWGAIL